MTTDKHGHIVRQEAQTDGTADSARPTLGPWKAVGSHRAWFIQTAEELTHQTPGILNVFSSEAIAELRDKETPEEVQANARLIAEAGTVANECGRTPRQLLEERDALYEALQALLVLSTTDSHGWSASEQQEKIKQARAALAMAKGAA